MPVVVTEKCINCKHTNCADVCPADAFYEGPNFLVVNPEQCIDCIMCIPACPVNAILEERNVPDGQRMFVSLNAELAAVWPKISKKVPAPPDTEEWYDVDAKLHYLER